MGTRAPGTLVFLGKTPRTQYSWRTSRLRERARRSLAGRAETSVARNVRSTAAKRVRIRAVSAAAGLLQGTGDRAARTRTGTTRQAANVRLRMRTSAVPVTSRRSFA